MNPRDDACAAMNHRGGFTGVVQIWRYNQRFYLTTLTLLAAAFAGAFWLPFALRIAVMAGALATLLWTVASLAVSHYIYDRSSLYDFSWMRAQLGFEPQSIASFHAGLDECSGLLAACFPAARLRVFDIFDRREMTEPSIARARELAAANPAEMLSTAADWRGLPAGSGEFDACFLMLAAHELRRPAARLQFFGELARVTRPQGTIVLVEHLRDMPNFLAFGPGFLHFFARRDWLLASEGAGLRCAAEFSITPFIRAFVLRREPLFGEP